MTIPFPRPLVLGHRGAPRAATENTLLSFARALELGADGVELDVQRSLDGVPVVIHDDDLKRTTTARGRISRLGWAAIERLTNGLVPDFEQVASWAAASGAWLNVEMKALALESEVAARIRELELTERVVISSFDPAIVAAVGRFAPELRRFLLTERWNGAARQARVECGAQGVCLRDDGATDEVLETLADEGLPVIVWTVNSPDRVRRLLRYGAAGIISDDPGMAARVRNER